MELEHPVPERPLVHDLSCECRICEADKFPDSGEKVRDLMPDKPYVFVYGSLKRGFFNHDHYLKGSTQIAVDVWLEDHALVHLGAFPAMYKANNFRVKGEVYQVSLDTLKALDRLEGVAQGFYFRTRVSVKTSPGIIHFCYAYCQYTPAPPYKRVMTGIWLGENSETIIIPATARNLPTSPPVVHPFVPLVWPGPLIFGQPEMDKAHHG